MRIPTATIILTRQEALNGCTKVLRYPILVHPLQLNLKSGLTDQTVIRLSNIQLYDNDGKIFIGSFHVTIRIHPVTTNSTSPNISHRTSQKNLPNKKKKKKSGWLQWISAVICLLIITSALDILPLDTKEEPPPYDFSGTSSYNPDTGKTTFYLTNEQEKELISIMTGETSSIPQDTLPAPIPQPLEEKDPSTLPSSPASSAPYERAVSLIPNFENKYFLPVLNERLLDCLCTIYHSVCTFQSSCTFSSYITVEEMSALYDVMRYECPELMHLDGYSYYYSGDQVTGIQLNYSMNKSEYETAYAKCLSVIYTLRDACIGMTELEKELYVIRYISKNCDYNKETKYCGTPYGVFGEGQAKCNGISLAMNWAMHEMGIQCTTISGRPHDQKIGHAWNIIRLDGKYYELDVTGEVCAETDQGCTSFCFTNIPGSWCRSEYPVDEAYLSIRSLPDTEWPGSYHQIENGILFETYDLVLCVDETVEFAEATVNSGEKYCIQFLYSSDMEEFLDEVSCYCQGIRETLDGVSFTYSSYPSANTVFFSVFYK